MNRSRRLLAPASLLLATLACGSASAQGQGATTTAPASAGPVLAPVTAVTELAAGDGWLVWSVPVKGGWGLEGRHAGVDRPLKVAPRPQPFDASVGTDARGGAVVTFSRCSTTPGVLIGLGDINPLRGRGCRAHVFDLSTNRESVPPIPRPADASDTTPAMWHGRIAFGRVDLHAHGQVEQVLLWTPGRATLRSLPHGALPTDCPFSAGCQGQVRQGGVEGLAYNGTLVSFLWHPVAPGVIGDAGWEVRADTVADGRSHLVGSGFAGEACTGGDDLYAPSPPLLEGTEVRFIALESSCYVFDSPFVQISATSGGDGQSATLKGIVLALAEDGSTFYALEAPKPASETDPSCSTALPCEIEQVEPPRLRPQTRKPGSPFF
ncbi:MAG TPA: hypothetical protein VHX88_08765 [Solirubrobacteraceae bacterium]|jgi:hypothetical protein|nr:hypothetical protein [Solirubrobacteraceae bacterium]